MPYKCQKNVWKCYHSAFSPAFFSCLYKVKQIGKLPFFFVPFALQSLHFDVKFLSNYTRDQQFQTTDPLVLLCYGLRGLLGCSESLWWVHPQAVLNIRDPQSFPPAENLSTVLPRRELWEHLSCLWKLSLSGSVFTG